MQGGLGEATAMSLKSICYTAAEDGRKNQPNNNINDETLTTSSLAPEGLEELQHQWAGTLVTPNTACDVAMNFHHLSLKAEISER